MRLCVASRVVRCNRIVGVDGQVVKVVVAESGGMLQVDTAALDAVRQSVLIPAMIGRTHAGYDVLLPFAPHGGQAGT